MKKVLASIQFLQGLWLWRGCRWRFYLVMPFDVITNLMWTPQITSFWGLHFSLWGCVRDESQPRTGSQNRCANSVPGAFHSKEYGATAFPLGELILHSVLEAEWPGLWSHGVAHLHRCKDHGLHEAVIHPYHCSFPFGVLPRLLPVLHIESQHATCKWHK